MVCVHLLSSSSICWGMYGGHGGHGDVFPFGYFPIDVCIGLCDGGRCCVVMGGV